MRVAKTVIAAIWNGPFFIGKLERPVSLGDVALKLLETSWRAGVVVSGAIASLVGYKALTEALPTSKALYQQVEASILWGEGCDGDMPLRVRLKNNSDQRLGRIDFKVAAYESGRSTNLVSFADRGHTSDVIMAPGATATLCVVAPEFQELARGKLAASLAYEVEVKGAEKTNLSANRPQRRQPASSEQPAAPAAVQLPPCVDGTTSCKPWDRAWNKRPGDMTDAELKAAAGLDNQDLSAGQRRSNDFDGSDIFEPGPK